MKIDWKEVSKSAGYKSLKSRVIKDCIERENCFNINGCDKRRAVKCFHRRCNTFKKYIDLAKKYSIKHNVKVSTVLDAWIDGFKRYLNYINSFTLEKDLLRYLEKD